MKPSRRIFPIVLLLGAALVVSSCARSTKIPAFVPAPMPRPDASGLAPANGIQIYYQAFNQGGGNPVLVLHGGCGTSDLGGHLVPALMKAHHVIAIDSRGHGRSTRDERPFTYHLMAEDTLAVMDYLRIPKVAIVGMSDGALVALDLAIHHSDRLSGVYLQGVCFSAAGKKPSATKPGDAPDPRIEAFGQWAVREYARLSPTPDRFEDFFKAISLMWEAEPNYSLSDLRRIATRTWVVHAEKDESVNVAHLEEMVRTIPGAKFEVLRDSGHMVSLENPALFSRSVLAFLEGK